MNANDAVCWLKTLVEVGAESPKWKYGDGQNGHPFEPGPLSN